MILKPEIPTAAPRLFHLVMDSLPAVIDVPMDEGLSGNEDNLIYKPLSRATLADLDAHLELLNRQINADTRRYRALQQLHDFALAMGASPQIRLLEMLARLAANDPEATPSRSTPN